MRIPKILYFFFVLVAFPVFVGAEPVCRVDPFDVTMDQGSFANTKVYWTSDSLFNLYDVSVGNLPISVDGGFSNSDIIRSSGETKSLSLILQAKPDAQIGSFMVSVIYKYKKEDQQDVAESVCQFNLRVSRKSGAYNYESIQGDVSKSVTNSLTSPLVIPQLKAPPIVILQRMSRGSKSDEVKTLQELLRSLKFFPEDEEATGYFGRITEGAVKEFQKSMNIDPIGIVGPKTRAAINSLRINQ